MEYVEPKELNKTLKNSLKKLNTSQKDLILIFATVEQNNLKFRKW